jgi:hypothetical protein
VAAVSRGMVVRFQLALEFMKLLKLLELLLNCLDALVIILDDAGSVVNQA